MCLDAEEFSRHCEEQLQVSNIKYLHHEKFNIHIYEILHYTHVTLTSLTWTGVLNYVLHHNSFYNDYKYLVLDKKIM